MQGLVTFGVCYFALGVLISAVLAVRRSRRSGSSLSPLWFLTDPTGWLLFLFWPVWLVIDLYPPHAQTSATESPPLHDLQPGMQGTVVTELRPAGAVRIGDRVVSALSRSEVIPSGTTVVVTSVELGGVKVKRADP